jgi:hypothetical protein
MRGTAWCYFHVSGRRSAKGRQKPLKLPELIDRKAIQGALNQVLNAIGPGRISQKSTGQLLFGLSIASNNLRSILPSSNQSSRERIARQQPLALDAEFRPTASTKEKA